MGNLYKIIENFSSDAGSMLTELVSLATATDSVSGWLSDRNNTEGLSLPRYVVKARAELSAIPISSFRVHYPTIMSTIANGNIDELDFGHRLHDAIYKLARLNERLLALNYLVKQPNDRSELSQLAKEITGELLIYIITRFRLADCDDGVYLCVQEFCNYNNLDAKEFYFMAKQLLDNTGVEPYGYEVLSPYRNALLEIDPVLLGECEDAGYPLTADICEKICNGAMSLAEVSGLLSAHTGNLSDGENSGLTPTNMISKLKLE